jgi:hypothetical protein
LVSRGTLHISNSLEMGQYFLQENGSSFRAPTLEDHAQKT